MAWRNFTWKKGSVSICDSGWCCRPGDLTGRGVGLAAWGHAAYNGGDRTSKLIHYRFPAAGINGVFDYRILYEINDKVRQVLIYAVGHRRSIYR